MAQAKTILYSYFRSSCSWRVRIALAHKNMEYEYKPVDIYKGEHKADWFRKLNPECEIPVFVHNGNSISHSLAILEYLEEVEPSKPLLPKDSASRAKVRGIMDSIICVQTLQNAKILNYIGEEKQKEWAKHWLQHTFGGIERGLQSTHGVYCVGDSVTLADLYLVPMVFNAITRFDVDMKQFKLIDEICTRLNSLQSFRVSHPFAQPDCPAGLIQ